MKTMLSSFFSDKLTDALGWTLLHSLWQGAVIALLMTVVLLLLSRRSAQVRYFVAVSALFLVVLAAGSTFVTLYFSGQPATDDSINQLAKPPTAAGILTQNSIPTEAKTPFLWESVSGRWVAYVEQHAPVIVTLWGLGILMLTLRFMGGLLYVQRLKQYKTQVVPAEWWQKTQRLSNQIGIHRTVQVLESALVKVPIAIGYFKPVVLLPIGTLTGLAPQQVEAILAHELAHIARNDYWVNIFQSIIEILFFFHPAVWWMSGIIRREREHCCDDIAVQLSGDRLTFAQALTNLEVMQTVPALALAAIGGRGSLLARIQRLLQQSPQKPTFNEGLLASGVLILCLVAISASAFSNLRRSDNTLRFARNSTFQNGKTPPSDSLADKTTYYGTFTDTSKVVREIIIVKDKKGNVTEVVVDGRKLSKNELKNYRQVIDQKLSVASKPNEEMDILSPEDDISDFPPIPPVAPVAPLPPMPEMTPLPPMPPVPSGEFDEKTTHAIDQLNDRIGELGDELGRMYEKQPYNEKRAAEIEERMSELSQQLSELGQSQYSSNASKRSKEYAAELQNYLHQLKQYERELERQLGDNNLSVQNEVATRNRALSERDRAFAEESRKMALQQRELARVSQEQARRSHHNALREHNSSVDEHNKAMEKHNKFVRVLVSKLRQDNLIPDEKSYRIMLTKKKLYVNGRQQPEEVFQKYKELIQKETGENLNEWKDTQQMEINHNWEQNTTEDESSLKFLWDLNKVMGKEPVKDNC